MIYHDLDPHTFNRFIYLFNEIDSSLHSTHRERLSTFPSTILPSSSVLHLPSTSNCSLCSHKTRSCSNVSNVLVGNSRYGQLQPVGELSGQSLVQELVCDSASRAAADLEASFPVMEVTPDNLATGISVTISSSECRAGKGFSLWAGLRVGASTTSTLNQSPRCPAPCRRLLPTSQCRHPFTHFFDIFLRFGSGMKAPWRSSAFPATKILQLHSLFLDKHRIIHRHTRERQRQVLCTQNCTRWGGTERNEFLLCPFCLADGDFITNFPQQVLHDELGDLADLVDLANFDDLAHAQTLSPWILIMIFTSAMRSRIPQNSQRYVADEGSAFSCSSSAS